MCAGKHGRFEHANDEANGIQLVDVGGAAGCKGGDAPEHFKRRQEPAGEFGPAHQHETGHLEDDVGGEVGDIEVVELVAVEAKVFLEAGDVGIGDVCLVCAPA